MTPEEEIRAAFEDGALTRDYLRVKLIQSEDKNLSEKLSREGIVPNAKPAGPRTTYFIDDE